MFPELRGETWAYALVYRQAHAAAKGNTAAASFVADRAERKEATVTGDKMLQQAAAELAAMRGRSGARS